MFKRFLSTFVMLSILTTQVGAASQHHAGLKEAFDELNYSLSIEWDQKDKDFQVQATEKFKANLQRMMAEGVSNEEVVDFVVSEVKDKNMSKSIRKAFENISAEKMSSSEVYSEVNKYLKSGLYNTGASWNGAVVVNAAVLTLVLVGVGAAIVYNWQSERGNSDAGGQCSPRTTCEDTVFNGKVISTCYEECK